MTIITFLCLNCSHCWNDDFFDEIPNMRKTFWIQCDALPKLRNLWQKPRMYKCKWYNRMGVDGMDEKELARGGSFHALSENDR